MTKLPDTITFDPDALTLGEMEEIEDAAGVPFQELISQFEQKKLSTRAMRAVFWILIRGDNPDYTFDDTRTLTVGDIGRLSIEDETDTPLAEVPSGEEE